MYRRPGSRVGGGNRVNVEGAMGRRCPKCKAAPGWRCGRYVGAVWEPNRTFHAERRKPRPEPGARWLDATATDAALRLAAEVEWACLKALLVSGGRSPATALPVMTRGGKPRR